jgi:hypothetical protein
VDVHLPAIAVVYDTITINASAIPSSGASIVGYTFTFGDNTQRGLQSVPTATHKYSRPGSYSILVVVTQSDGANGQATATIQITPPRPLIAKLKVPMTALVGAPRLPESEGCDPTPDYEQADQSWDE